MTALTSWRLLFATVEWQFLRRTCFSISFMLLFNSHRRKCAIHLNTVRWCLITISSLDFIVQRQAQNKHNLIYYRNVGELIFNVHSHRRKIDVLMKRNHYRSDAERERKREEKLAILMPNGVIISVLLRAASSWKWRKRATETTNDWVIMGWSIYCGWRRNWIQSISIQYFSIYMQQHHSIPNINWSLSRANNEATFHPQRKYTQKACVWMKKRQKKTEFSLSHIQSKLYDEILFSSRARAKNVRAKCLYHVFFCIFSHQMILKWTFRDILPRIQMANVFYSSFKANQPSLFSYWRCFFWSLNLFRRLNYKQ